MHANPIKIIAIFIASIIILALAPVAMQYSWAKAFKGNTAENKKGKELCGIDAALQEPLLACKYYVDQDFKRSVLNVTPQDNIGGQLLGGIVTHHLLADSLIASFFSAVSGSKPEIVFVVGPNHKRAGRAKINTGHWDWQTPFGVLETDGRAVGGLIESCNAGENFELLEAEHSVSALVPYIKYYMPEAKIVPVLLHGDYGLEASRALAGKIKAAAGDRSWIAIGSIDFSHYLTPEASRKMDEITLKAIEQEDFDSLSRMGNDNLDSPASAIALLELMKEQGDYELKVLGHSDAAEVAGRYSGSTTSYFTMLFYQR